MSFHAGMSKVTGDIHPSDSYLRVEAIPSVWCSGCGIGLVVHTFIQTLKYLRFDLNKLCVVSGLGCTGKIAEYLKLSSFQITHSNPIEYAEDFKLKNPNFTAVVFLNDVDFMVSGANDFIGAGKRKAGLCIIYINNFIYHIFIEGKVLAKTPFIGAPADSNVESPFNIPHLAKSCGAQYVARWTLLHVRRLMYSITDALQRPNFSVIEVIAPCLMYFAGDGVMRKPLRRMEYLYDNSMIKHGTPTENLDLRYQDKIIVGRFVDHE